MKSNSKRGGKSRGGGGNNRIDHLTIVKNGDSGQKVGSPARRARAFRRFWLFLLASALVLIGLASAFGVLPF